MFQWTTPRFGKGRILKKEMLDNLRDFPRDFADIYYKDYTNGIISGSELVVGGTEITIKKGIIKHNGFIYMLQEECKVPYFNTNVEMIIKIKFFEEESAGDFLLRNSKIFIDDNLECADDELEFGRFKLREGAILRSEYMDLKDFSTEYNTINIINASYAGHLKPTMNPLVLRYFGEIVFKFNSESAHDVALATQCTSQNYVDREVILWYLVNKLGVQYKDYTNMEIYKYLCQIARDIESGRRRKPEEKVNNRGRIMVD